MFGGKNVNKFKFKGICCYSAKINPLLIFLWGKISIFNPNLTAQRQKVVFAMHKVQADLSLETQCKASSLEEPILYNLNEVSGDPLVFLFRQNL